LLNKGLATGAKETLAWLDTHLGGAAPQRPSRVRVCVTGQGWRHLADWPAPTAERALYLRPGGYLDETAPTQLAGVVPATFRYDPADPTPTTGGPPLGPGGRYRDDTRLHNRETLSPFT